MGHRLSEVERLPMVGEANGGFVQAKVVVEGTESNEDQPSALVELETRVSELEQEVLDLTTIQSSIAELVKTLAGRVAEIESTR